MAAPRRLFVLDLGRVETDSNWILPLRDPATSEDPQRRARWVRVPTLAFLVEHSEAGWILFDTGCHPRAMEGHWPRQLALVSPWRPEPRQQLPEQLALLGLTPADVGTIVLSHLHMDHAGGLVHFAGLPALDGVVVHQDELAWALLRCHQGRRRHGYGYVAADFADVDGSRFELLRGDRWIAEGVQALALPGHTPGSIGLRVDLPESGPLLLPSDAVYSAANYGPPLRPPASVHDGRALEASVDRLRELERRDGARILYSHDWSQYSDGLVLAPGSYS